MWDADAALRLSRGDIVRARSLCAGGGAVLSGGRDPGLRRIPGGAVRDRVGCGVPRNRRQPLYRRVRRSGTGVAAAQSRAVVQRLRRVRRADHRGNVHLRSEEHTSELQSLMRISYAVFCLKKKKNMITTNIETYTHMV